MLLSESIALAKKHYEEAFRVRSGQGNHYLAILSYKAPSCLS